MILDKVEIRKTGENDFNNIMEVEKLAFGYDKEAKLYHTLNTVTIGKSNLPKNFQSPKLY